MSDELAVIERGAVSVATSALPLDAILKAAQDPGTDVAKVESMIALYERMQASAARQAFNAAMVACQGEMPRVTKDAKIISHKTGAVQSRYATLERIDSVVRPIYERHGFSISYNTAAAENGKFVVTAIVRHSGGHSEEYRIPLALDQTGAKNDTQGMGSVMSYGRRYLLCSIFNIITEGEDNDGQGKVERLTAEQISNILNLLNAANRAEADLLRWLGAAKLEDVAAARYSEILTAIGKASAKAAAK